VPTGEGQILEEFPSLHGHIFVDIYKLLEISQSGGKRKNATNVDCDCKKKNINVFSQVALPLNLISD